MAAFPKMKHALYSLALLSSCGLALLAHMRYFARVDLERTELSIDAPGWQGGELRLAVLADLHARPEDGEYVDRIVRETLALKPDAVLLLGDYVNGHSLESAMPLDELARRLKPLAKAPCFAVLGNHDHYCGAALVREKLESAGIVFVEGRREELAAKGSRIDIGGLCCLYTFAKPDKTPEPQPGVPMVLLSHSPMGIKHLPAGTVLLLAGHTHGGQICWPGGSPVYMADGKTPRSLAAGLVSAGGSHCYVSRGLGTSLLPLRLFCRPELLLVKIH